VALVFIPTRLRRLTGGLDRVTVAGSTLRELIASLDRRFPGFRAAVVEGEELSPSIAVSIDGEVVPGALAESVGESSEVHFIPPLSGGI
jgi:sulfur-carrier protein